MSRSAYAAIETRLASRRALLAPRRASGIGASSLALAALLAAALALPAAASAAPPNLCPPGAGAGRCNAPAALALDNSTGAPASGDLYVSEHNNNRVDVFDPAGHFLRAFGVGVLNGANQLQTCSATCIPGRESSSFRPAALAVPVSGPFAHDLYAFNASQIERYEYDESAHEYKLLPGSFGSAGTGPGQFSGEHHSLAFDASGNLWVGDKERLEEFSAAGAFLSEIALPGTKEVSSLAIDTDPASPSFEDLYTLKPPIPGADEEQRVIPPSSGTYTLCFEGQCTKAIPFNAPPAGGAGSVQEALEALSTIGPGNVEGHTFCCQAGFAVIFKGTFARTDVPQISASGGSTVDTLRQGESEVSGVLTKRKPNGEALATLDAAGHPTAAAIDPASGNVFVNDQLQFAGGAKETLTATLLSFDPAGEQLEAFGAGEVIGTPAENGLAFGSTAQRLYVVSTGTGAQSGLQAFAAPPPGPLPLAGAAQAKEIAKLAATLCARVNPENAATTAHFEYISAAKFKENEEEGHDPFTGASRAPASSGEDTSLPADFSSDHQVCQPIAGLQPAIAYRFRLIAHNSNGENPGEAATFETLPPAAIDSSSATDISAESATLQAEINPLGDATSYHFEYLTEEEFLANLKNESPAFFGARQAPLQPAPLGAGSSDLAVSQHLQGLQSGTVYRYRVVVQNQLSEEHGGPYSNAARSFSTQTPGAVALLPDHRAYEQVSPPEKYGASITPVEAEASSSGDALRYQLLAPTEANPAGRAGGTETLSARGSGGWLSQALTTPHERFTSVANGAEQEFRAFSSDLSTALVYPVSIAPSRLSPAASGPTIFLHSSFATTGPPRPCAESCYRPVLVACPSSGPCPPAVEAAADMPPGTEIPSTEAIHLTGYTPDLSHLVLQAKLPLTSTGFPGGSEPSALYEFSAAAPASQALRLLSVLPNGEPARGSHFALENGLNQRGAISADGSRVVFSTGYSGERDLYLRLNATAPSSASGECTAAEPAASCTLQLDAVQGGTGGGQPNATFQFAAAEGSRIFFTDLQQLTAGASESGEDLYECRIVENAGLPACQLTDLTPEIGGRPSAVQGLVLGGSTDGEYLYFVANGVLAPGAAPGTCDFQDVGKRDPSHLCNLYLRRGSETLFLATLSAADLPDWATSLTSQTSAVSPDGRWLSFMSNRPLTGYDNRDAASGQPDQEVFLYHAPAGAGEEGKLICASCTPTGARPNGVEFGPSGENMPLAAGAGTRHAWPQTAWLAANLPGWNEFHTNLLPTWASAHQPRYLSDSGRLFFDSHDALVPADTNDTEDVYQWEPPAGGSEEPPNDTCAATSPAYFPASGGCLSLISSGTSSEESVFRDASASGDDVFFISSSRLAPSDLDTAPDIYDARAPHVPGETVGFPAPIKPVECLGDACQPPATPPNDATPGSLTFHGAGNVHEEKAPSPRCKKGEVKRRGKCVTKKPHRHHKRAHRRSGPNRGGHK